MPESKPSVSKTPQPAPVSNTSTSLVKAAFYVLLSLIVLMAGILFLIILTKLPGTF